MEKCSLCMCAQLGELAGRPTDADVEGQAALADGRLHSERRRHHLAAVHGQREEVPRALAAGDQVAHEVHRGRVEGRRQPGALLVRPVAAAAGRDPQQLAALQAQRA